MAELWTNWFNETGRFLAGSLSVLLPFLLLAVPALVMGWLVRRWLKSTAEDVHKELGREKEEARWHRHRMRQYRRG